MSRWRECPECGYCLEADGDGRLPEHSRWDVLWTTGWRKPCQWGGCVHPDLR